MKLPQPEHGAIERGGDSLDAENVFSIRATAHTFAVLSSALYSDKIAAPIRELCCNAYDAHVAAGTTHLPFEVTLPTIFDPIFKVRDYGTGLSNADVMELYTTYFGSTKQDSNEVIGALGLGSKSPFAYTSSFTVESRFNGKVSSFAMFINEMGLPTVTALVLDVPTDEPNGLTVSFPVDIDDTTRFYEKARRILMYFPVPPVVHGRQSFEPYSLQHTMGGTNWKVRDASYYAYMDGAYVIQGSVAYPLKTDLLEDQLSPTARTVVQLELDLFLPIGDVAVAPSREALSYDTVTINNLIRHIEMAASEIRDVIQAKFNAVPNMWEARTLLWSMTHHNKALGKLTNAMHKQNPFKYNGVDIQLNIAVDLSTTPSVNIEVWTTSTKYGRRKGTTVAELLPVSETFTGVDIVIQQSTIVIIDDMGRSFRSALKAYMLDKHSKTDRNQHVIAIRTDSGWTGVHPDHLAHVLTCLGVASAPTASSIGLRSVAAGERSAYYRPRRKSERLVFTGFPDTKDRYREKAFSRLTWAKQEIDLDAGGFYVNIERFEVKHPTADVIKVDRLKDRLEELIPDLNITVVGFTDKEIASTDMSNWVNLFDYALEQITAILNDPARVSAVSKEKCAGNINGMANFLSKVWPNMKFHVKDGLFKDFCNSLCAGSHDHALKEEYDRAMDVARYCGHYDNSATVSFEKWGLQKWKEINRTYGMMSLINLHTVTVSNCLPLVDYINACEDAFLYNQDRKVA